MADRSMLQLGGISALLSVAVIAATIGVGIVVGGGGPVAIDFGDPAVLNALRGGGQGPVILSLLALVAPALSLGAGVGWHWWLKERGGYVKTGVALWYFGMVFVLFQDALELSLVAHLPAAYAEAQGAQAEALLAAGGLLGKAIETFMVLGDLISFAGLLLVNAAIWSLGGKWRILAAIGFASCVLIALGITMPGLTPARLPGFILFTVWMTWSGIAMLRWRPTA